VLLALIELPRKERGGGPSGVVEMFVRYVGGSFDGVVLLGGLKKNLGSRGGVLGKSSESGTWNMLATMVAYVGAVVYLVVNTTINRASWDSFRESSGQAGPRSRSCLDFAP
jgi:hypothetical protein